MRSIPHALIAAIVFAVALGLPIGFYLLLTRGLRRTTREIRVAAGERGWRYRRHAWGGDPTSFQIHGSTTDGQPWIMTTQGTGGKDRGWTVRLGLLFPMLGGKEDFAIEPRGSGLRASTSLRISATTDAERRVAGLSEVLSREIAFYRQARELSSGSPEFDAAYQILVLPDRAQQSPIGPALAERMLCWPKAAVQAYSIRSWRDPYGVHVQARLPGPPNWAAVSYFVAIAEEMIPHLPPPVPSAPARTLLDRIFAHFS